MRELATKGTMRHVYVQEDQQASVKAEAEKEPAKKNEEELPNAELPAPEFEWAVLEDPLESEEPNEPGADESEDDQEPETHLEISGSGGPGHPEELEAHPDAADSNRVVSEQRTALTRLQTLRILYDRCPPK